MCGKGQSPRRQRTRGGGPNLPTCQGHLPISLQPAHDSWRIAGLFSHPSAGCAVKSRPALPRRPRRCQRHLSAVLLQTVTPPGPGTVHGGEDGEKREDGRKREDRGGSREQRAEDSSARPHPKKWGEERGRTEEGAESRGQRTAAAVRTQRSSLKARRACAPASWVNLTQVGICGGNAWHRNPR